MNLGILEKIERKQFKKGKKTLVEKCVKKTLKIKEIKIFLEKLLKKFLLIFIANDILFLVSVLYI